VWNFLKPESFRGDILQLYIFDIDGTIAKDDLKKKLTWQEFYTPEVLKDLPSYSNVVNLIRGLDVKESVIVFLTGRKTSLEEVTYQWLAQQLGKTTFRLLTRAEFIPYQGILPFKLSTIFRLQDELKPQHFHLFDNDLETLQALNLVYKDNREVSIYKCQEGLVTRVESIS
jgi:hypothetical protein